MRNYVPWVFALSLTLLLMNLTASCPASAQRLLVSSYGTHDVKRFDVMTTTFLGNFLTGNGLDATHAVIYGQDGNLYVASEANSVLRFDSNTGAFIDAFV